MISMPSPQPSLSNQNQDYQYHVQDITTIPIHKQKELNYIYQEFMPMIQIQDIAEPNSTTCSTSSTLSTWYWITQSNFCGNYTTTNKLYWDIITCMYYNYNHRYIKTRTINHCNIKYNCTNLVTIETNTPQAKNNNSNSMVINITSKKQGNWDLCPVEQL